MAIEDDLSLLDMMMADDERQPALYRAGPFWRTLCERSVAAIRAQGISDFRGRSTPAGWAFTDSLFDETESTDRYLRNIAENPRLDELLSTYRLPDTMQCGCLDYIVINDTPVSRHYLNLLDQHDQIARSIPFKTMRSALELGGGFGVNVHLLISNYPNIKKIVYLDIPPNLYIGTQYLKLFYGGAVRDYREMRETREVGFRNDDSLEIIATAPWQIEQLNEKIDLFYNAHSFVEMTEGAVANYAAQLRRLPDFAKAAVAMLSYAPFDLGTTFHPDKLPTFFPERRFKKRTFPSLDHRLTFFAFVSPTGRRSWSRFLPW